MATDLLKALIEKIDKKTYLSIIHCLAQKNKRMRIPGFSTLEKTPQALVINTAKTNKNFKDAFLDACVEVILDGQTIDYSISLTENKEKIDSVHWLGLAAAFLKRNDEQDVKEILGIISGCGAEKETEVKEEVKTDAKQEKREERFREKYLKAHAEVERLTALIETQKNELENAIAQRDNFAELVDGLKIEKENLLRMLSEKEEEIKQLRSFSAGAKEGDSKEQSPKASLTVKRIYAPNCQDLLGKYVGKIMLNFEDIAEKTKEELHEQYDQVWVLSNTISFATSRKLSKWMKDGLDNIVWFSSATELVTYAEDLI